MLYITLGLYLIALGALYFYFGWKILTGIILISLVAIGLFIMFGGEGFFSK